nr:RF6 [Oryza sativa Indica Group]
MSSRRVRVTGLGRPDAGVSRTKKQQQNQGLPRQHQQQQEAGGGGRAGREHAHHLFDELLRRDTTSIFDLNSALSAVASESPAVALSLFNRMPRADLCTYNIVIGCCSRAGHLDLAFAALGRVIRTGWTAQAITFSPLLKGLCHDKRTSDAMDIALRRMPALGCTPNAFSYNILLKGLCDENRSQQALHLLHTMMADDTRGGCPPDVVSYTTVINGLLREGQLDKAYCLFDEMLDQGMSPNCITYNCLLH